MPSPSRKGIAILLLVALLTIMLAFIPNILSGDVDTWLKTHAGEKYKFVLVALLPFCAVVLVLLTTDLGKHLFPGSKNKSADLAPNIPDPDLVAKVRKYLTERYTHRLSQKLAGRQPVNLRILPSLTGTSKEGAENYITLQEEEVRAAIGDIFTRANGRLLLVGLPGAGKTTLVLQLALHLLERPGSSMPVVLNLATWRAEFKTFEEWLKKILPTELGASTGLAEQIRKYTPLILLLDGLDEVPEADRDSLLAGIGEYGADAERQFLISSRIAEYAATKDAPVNVQVEVAPLTVEQVEMGLAATAGLQPESKRLLNALKSDPLLREAVESPFYLNTAQLLFSTGKNWSELGFVAQDVGGRQRELVERFISGALGRSVQHEYPANKAGHWLSFLASRMTERNMVVFELRDLQYDWWRWSKKQITYANLISAIVIGQFFFLVTIIFVVPVFGLGLGFAKGLDIGLKFGLFFLYLTGIFLLGIQISEAGTIPIATFGNINWSWKRLLVSQFIGFLAGITLTIIVALCILLITVLIGFLLALFGWDSGLNPLDVGLENGKYLVVDGGGLAMGLFGGALGGLYSVFLFLMKSADLIQIHTPYQRFKSSMRLLWFSILQHKFLSYQLHKQGLLPPNLVTFLNELSARHILETDSATWRFRHRILQEWFAEKWVEMEENKSKNR